MEVQLFSDPSRKEYAKIIQMAKKANDDKHRGHSRDMLKKHIKTKLNTTMIGAISTFENMFGDLWGHGKNETQLTQTEEEFRELWNIVRTEILNKGNEQLRAAMSEIDNYSVQYNKMRYEFLINKKEQDNDK